MPLKRIIILGGGFGGVAAVRALKGCDAEVLLLDRRNHHIFQPLLYQVATAVLAPSEVAAPLRQLSQEQPNLSVMMGEVTGVDLASKIVRLKAPGLPERRLAFDYLVVATGVHPTYFGHDEFAAYAPSLKTLADAEVIRARVLSAYELAEQTDDLEERSRALTFVLVGGGATGVELAASIAQMARITLRRNFRRIDAVDTTILLLEGGKRILANFDESLSHKAARRLEKLGVTVRTGVVVEVVDERGVFTSGERIESATVLWTAGVQASPIVKMLDTTTDRAGRACVGPFLSLADHPNVFVVGDAAAFIQADRPLPGVAQVAIQQGRYVGKRIAGEIRKRRSDSKPFEYFDRGNMAVVGKNFAVLERGRIRTSGFATWLLWAFLHVMFLPQLQNRLRVQMQWLWSYFSGQRSSRLIPEPLSEKPERVVPPVGTR
ncbi:NAD(P)/FAD-dependent oxidoreductase [Rhodanobacter glycinis]|uniref:NAD(P)/FAD-dependent oxidoreductase n=1 Tax=Rhodanobacter glycinis TaxID=582702 RepID=UPI001129B393|nr:NAD(P)/FAD-dependent oxidoreductase [Rhodanobacter glycinis]TPG50757.1 NAD(P)/FAD-dependent oxidoreductase [Rhodanobacter glycinis]